MFSFDLTVQAIAFGAFLWLAFFIISRADRQRPQTVITFLALFSMACLFFSLGLINHTHGPLNPILTRLFWWSDVLPMAFWLHVTSQIVRHEVRPLLTWQMWLNYLAAIIISILGSTTDLYLNFSSAERKILNSNDITEVSYYYGPGVLYFTYILYLAIAGGGSLWNLYHSLRREQKAQTNDPNWAGLIWKLKLLLLGGMLFIIGAVYQTLRQQFYSVNPVWEWPGHSMFLAGLVLLSYSVAQYGMLVMGKNIQRDFVYSITGVIVINFLYVGLVALTAGLTPQSLLIIIGLATTTHTLYDFFRELLDRFFFSKDEQRARSDAWAYATALASSPVLVDVATLQISATPQELPSPGETDPTAAPETQTESETESISADDEKNFYNIVRRAITSLKNPTQLVKSPLLGMRLIERRLKESGLEDNRLNRATILREVLLEYIERLRPQALTDGPATPGTGDAWRFYNVLYFPYVRQISRKAALSEARRLEVERKRNGLREASELEQVLNWLTDVDEDTFYKWQRRASDTIASLLREEELRFSHNPAAVTLPAKQASAQS